MCRRQCIASQLTAEYAWYASSGPMSPITLASPAVPAPSRGAGGGAGAAAAVGAVVGAAGTIDPPIICTVRYTTTWRARPAATAKHADMTGESCPLVAKPTP